MSLLSGLRLIGASLQGHLEASGGRTLPNESGRY
jgi:hypothetical protein